MTLSSSHQLIGDGYIASVHCSGRELLRRIFVTVRDRNWHEVAPTRFDSTVGESGRRIDFSARHTSELVDFEWQGTLTVSDDARHLHFSFKGKAMREMELCRLGLIVLHPPDSMIGACLTLLGPQAEQHLMVAPQIAPQPIVNGLPAAMTEPFCELRIERPNFGKLILRFTGDLFELEDQRNWGDASFKTYCTPLRLGFPRTVTEGTVISQSVDVSYEPASISVALQTKTQQDGAIPISITLPALGCEWRGGPLRDPDLAWDHVYVDSAAHDFAQIRALMTRPTPTKFQLGFEAPEARSISAEWLALLREHRERLAGILLYGSGTGLPAVDVIECWRNELSGSIGPEVTLLAATRGYYVEFNRRVTLDAPICGVAFPLTATVHADDAETVIKNAPIIRDMADTVRHLTRSAEVALVPLALYYPQSTQARHFPSHLIEPWLASTLSHAAAVGISSITIADDVQRAVLPRAGGSMPHHLRRLVP